MSNVSSDDIQKFSSNKKKTGEVNCIDEESIVSAIGAADVLINSLGGCFPPRMVY